MVLIARGTDGRDRTVGRLPHTVFRSASVVDPESLTRALAGCDAVALCAGIHREIGGQTFNRVHLEGTATLIESARTAGIRRIALLSPLRAGPGSGSRYQESRWQAEEELRQSGLEFTVLKSSLLYGRSDHLVDHISRSLMIAGRFATAGLAPVAVRPVAIEDLTGLFRAVLVGGRLSGQTVAVTGPEALSFRELVHRIAVAIGKRIVLLPLPVFLRRTASVWPLQARMLTEGESETRLRLAALPDDLAPRRRFTPAQIRCGLPPLSGLRWTDLRCCE
jgi:uncharacterized protein YbjT (DUF2867 family)